MSNVMISGTPIDHINNTFFVQVHSLLMVINYEASFVRSHCFCGVGLERRSFAMSYRQKHFAKEIIDKKGGTHLPAETDYKEKKRTLKKNPTQSWLIKYIQPPLPSLPKTKCLDDGATVPTLSTGQLRQMSLVQFRTRRQVHSSMHFLPCRHVRQRNLTEKK